jgi:hypothetical protein
VLRDNTALAGVMNAGHFRLRLVRRFDDTPIAPTNGFVAIRIVQI